MQIFSHFYETKKKMLSSEVPKKHIKFVLDTFCVLNTAWLLLIVQAIHSILSLYYDQHCLDISREVVLAWGYVQEDALTVICWLKVSALCVQ